MAATGEEEAGEAPPPQQPFMKQCSKCKTMKVAAASFWRDPTKKSGYTSWCKACFSESAERRKADGPPVVVTERECSICKIRKPAAAFMKDSRRITGLDARCRECRRKQHAARKQRNIEAGNQAWQEKECKRCKTVKPADEFKRHAYTTSGLDSWCKACCRERRKELMAQKAMTNLAEGAAPPDAATTSDEEEEEAVGVGPSSMVPAKSCGSCGIVKPGTAFARDRSQPDALARRCKTCDREHRRGKRQCLTPPGRASPPLEPASLPALLAAQQQHAAALQGLLNGLPGSSPMSIPSASTTPYTSAYTSPLSTPGATTPLARSPPPSPGFPGTLTGTSSAPVPSISAGGGRAQGGGRSRVSAFAAGLGSLPNFVPTQSDGSLAATTQHYLQPVTVWPPGITFATPAAFVLPAPASASQPASPSTLPAAPRLFLYDDEAAAAQQQLAGGGAGMPLLCRQSAPPAVGARSIAETLQDFWRQDSVRIAPSLAADLARDVAGLGPNPSNAQARRVESLLGGILPGGSGKPSDTEAAALAALHLPGGGVSAAERGSSFSFSMLPTASRIESLLGSAARFDSLLMSEGEGPDVPTPGAPLPAWKPTPSPLSATASAPVPLVGGAQGKAGAGEAGEEEQGGPTPAGDATMTAADSLPGAARDESLFGMGLETAMQTAEALLGQGGGEGGEGQEEAAGGAGRGAGTAGSLLNLERFESLGLTQEVPWAPSQA